ncbi:predicted protein [Aspergillus terreus NIH2624]|uniref:Rhamnolipids biosynthesis 3-oxoacyl-[acyl-carrier-protein] reductase n=1 Tax=Aspergillus terreus (strain NIH 2624 / FGSC A1156) TaxID=341663 RepID=Q0CG90_ASPTN|nr:uncharacterized protein ATEG_07302 [Aspergillus terreus NIH2624]EAU32686.1 predicted protein [Aspergillus terreus NIH2624]
MSDLADFPNSFNLNGKAALVTGANSCRCYQNSGGLGLHAATAFLRAGAKIVFITARKQTGVDEAVNELNKLPGISVRAIGIAANVANTEAIQRLVDQVKQYESKLDILVANAGATWGGPFEPTPDWASQKVLDLNVRGLFNLAMDE